MEEIEVKFLGVNPQEIEKILISLGAKKVYDRVFIDRIFDYPGWPLDAKASWLRLRDKSDEITLSFKKRVGVVKGKNDRGMEEIEIAVSDFKKTSDLLESIGMVQKFNEEKRRVHFKLGSVDIDIDTWPMIPTYLEIEGKNWDDVEKVAGKLGLKWKDKKKMAAMQVYRLYGIEEKDYSIITFDRQVKRKK